AVLQDPQRRPGGRPVHEPDLYLPAEPGQPVRVPDRAAAARRRARGQPPALDAMELPRRAGLSVDDHGPGRTSRSPLTKATLPAFAERRRESFSDRWPTSQPITGGISYPLWKDPEHHVR